jgi:hypothetical protein
MKRETPMKRTSELGMIRSALTLADTVGRNQDGTYTARRGFFYRHGGTASSFRDAVSATLNKLGMQIIVLDNWEHWTGFRGGASVRNQSHWGVRFMVTKSADM